MLVVEDLHHRSIPATEAQRSIEFYRSVLGLEELDRPDFDFKGGCFRLGVRQLHLLEKVDAMSLRGSSAIDSRDGRFALWINS